MKKIFVLFVSSVVMLFAHEFNVGTTAEFREALNNAATNGEDDTIILADGIYKTTADGVGTFIYSGNEDKNLTIKGSNSKNVILSGDSSDQILNHKSTVGSDLLILENISFVDGNSSEDGGAVYTDSFIMVKDCNFSDNNAIIKTLDGNDYYDGNGGGFYSIGSATVSNSIFNNNNGGFYTMGSAIVNNSTFDNNNGNNGGGFYAIDSAIVSNCIFTKNHAFSGGGFYSGGSTTVVSNSIFNDNSATGGDGGAFYSNSVKATNLLLKGNSSGIFMESGSDIIVNSIFLNNNISDISGYAGITISYLKNNYIDTSRIRYTDINNKSNNIYNVNLGFKDASTMDYHLTGSSELINRGTTDISGLTIPETDLDGNQRVMGQTIDIGPYEYDIVDSDGDGYIDPEDAFPNDPTEWLDTDGDGIGNNADTDDDNDGISDDVEIKYRLNPLNPNDANEDADGDGFSNIDEVRAGTDLNDVNSHPNFSDIKLYQGWNLISMQESNLSKLDSAINIIWGYQNKKWYAYSNSPTIEAKIKDANISQINSINNSEGVWVFLNKDANITINTNSVKNYTFTKDWNLLGIDKTVQTSIFDNSCVSYVWGYDSINKKWELYRSDGVNKYFGYTKFTDIKANSGFWVYGESSCDINLTKGDNNVSSGVSDLDNNDSIISNFNVNNQYIKGYTLDTNNKILKVYFNQEMNSNSGYTLGNYYEPVTNWSDNYKTFILKMGSYESGGTVALHTCSQIGCFLTKDNKTIGNDFIIHFP